MDGLLWLLPGAPLLGSLLCGLLHFRAIAARRAGSGGEGAMRLAASIAVFAMAIAFGLAVRGFLNLRGLEVEARSIESTAWHWMQTGTFPIDVSLVLDPLSSVMTLVITGVGLLIHIYATGYMKGDPGYAKFFAYLNLFVSAMLLLVLSSSLPGLFVGWEGVGLCSYLLIGFWYEKSFAAEAGQKAFVMNRIGDACFLLRRGRRSRSRASSPSSEHAAGRRGSRCSRGCPPRWPVRRPARRSPTPRRWSRPGSTFSRD